MIHVFVDDSGALYDPYETVVTVVALVTSTPQSLQWIIRRVRRDVKPKRSQRRVLSEFKFHNTSGAARGRVLAALAREDVQIYALSAHKGNQRVEDTPENYAILLCALMQSIEDADGLWIDQHFSRADKAMTLSNIVQHTLGLAVAPRFVDSRNNPFIQLADFVAGAIRYAHSGRTTLYREFILSRIVSDELIPWRDLKREWLKRIRGK